MNVQYRQWLPLLTTVFFVLATNPVSAQKSPASTAPIGMPQDWSHRHVVYSNPDTPQEAAKKGQTAKWRKNYLDPRFVLALSRKLERQEAAKYTGKIQPKDMKPLKPRELISETTGLTFRAKPVRPGIESGIHRDWSQVMGGSGGVGIAGVYPAKYSFNIFATPDCDNDFVVYPTGTAGATATAAPAANDFERRTLTFNNDPGNAATVTIGTAGTARSITLFASATLNTGQNFQNITDNNTRAINLTAAANRWSHQTGITASRAGAVVTFRRNTPGNLATVPLAGTEDADGNGDMNLNGGNNGGGNAGQPTIVAFNQLYASCNNDDPKQPRVMWSYNTGAGAIVETSPVLSYYDANGGGRQVAFVQRTGTTASLVLLKWSSAAPGTAGAPTVPTPQTLANYRSCTAPCMTVMTFVDSANVNHTSLDNRISSPYVDYSNDVIWVGDADGFLHKFTGVFLGTPAEVNNASFPAEVSNGTALSSPVVDFGNGQVFVGSASGGAGIGGRLHRVNSSTGAVVSSAKLTVDNSPGVRTSPILDSSAGRAYAFIFDDFGGSGSGGGTNCNDAPGNDWACRAVIQFDTAFSAGATASTTLATSLTNGRKTMVGRGNSTTSIAFGGTFDDAYYSSATPDGSLYVCGGNPDDTNLITLWRIPITNNVMGTAVQGAQVSTALADCSGISEIKNGTNDYLYFSLAASGDDGTANVCTGSCLYMFNLSDLNGTVAGTGDPWGTANVPSAGLIVFGGTGGIIMDNISTNTDASQIYFSNTTAPGNAYQASQSGLQ